MNRKYSFERHRKSCKDKIKGAKTRSFQPYQCHMARTSPSALMDHILPKLTELCRGRQGLYQQVEDRENNNYSYNNNNYTENDREVGVFRSGPGLKVWQMITKNIMGINCLYSQVQRKSGFLPISSEVDLAEVGVVRVALVSMGEHIGLLDNWYTLPDEGASELDPFPDFNIPDQRSQEN